MSLREHRPNAIPARQILEMATMGGARALGLADEIRSLEPGKCADLIALDTSDVGWSPLSAQRPYTALVYAINGSYVRDVMVDGQWLLRAGAWTTLDHAAARRDLEAACVELLERRRAAA
jgi:5-methylthioadenosine/S-adenosylhomocysteine deaminase